MSTLFQNIFDFFRRYIENLRLLCYNENTTQNRILMYCLKVHIFTSVKMRALFSHFKIMQKVLCGSKSERSIFVKCV